MSQIMSIPPPQMSVAVDDTPYTDYVEITDDTGSIAVTVPAEWSDIEGAPFERDGRTFYDVRASSDLNAFESGFTTPGVIVTASFFPDQSVTPATLLDERFSDLDNSCEDVDPRDVYDDGLYTGEFDVFNECGGVGATVVVIGAGPADQQFLIRTEVQLNSNRDLEALATVLDTFIVLQEPQ